MWHPREPSELLEMAGSKLRRVVRRRVVRHDAWTSLRRPESCSLHHDFDIGLPHGFADLTPDESSHRARPRPVKWCMSRSSHLLAVCHAAASVRAGGDSGGSVSGSTGARLDTGTYGLLPAHVSYCSASTAPRRGMMAARLGKMPGDRSDGKAPVRRSNRRGVVNERVIRQRIGDSRRPRVMRRRPRGRRSSVDRSTRGPGIASRKSRPHGCRPRRAFSTWPRICRSSGSVRHCNATARAPSADG